MSQITLGNACKETTRFSLPLIGFRTVVSINSFFAMLLIAALGRRELAACALVNSIQITLNITGWSILFAISIVVGYVFGQGKISDLGKVLRQGCIIGLILSVPTILLFWHVGSILRIFGQDENLIVLIEPYFRILAFGVLPGMLYISFVQFMTGIGKPRIMLYFSLINVFFLLLPGYLLMFGKMGLPKLGMMGMAYANTLVMWLAFFMALIYLLANKSCRKYQIFRLPSREELFYFKKILKIGIPMSIQIASELSAFAFSVIIVGWLGQTALAAAQIVNQMNMIVIMGPYGISMASSVLVGQAFGRGDKHAVRAYSSAGLIVGLVCTTIIALGYFVFPREIISFYSVDTNDPANFTLVHLATILFLIVAFSQLFDGLRNIATGALRGFHDSVTPMWIGVAASWLIGIPLSYWLGIKLDFGVKGVSFAFLIAWIFGAVLLINRLYRKTKICDEF